MTSFNLKNIPSRLSKPRTNGLTMVMDKGLGIAETENFLSVCSDYTDLVKLGFGTSIVTQRILSEKIKLYKSHDIKVFFGGTLFEAFIIRNQFDDYVKLLEQYQLECVEVSDGSITLPHEKKCEYIEMLSKKFTVLSEVGSKDAKKHFPPRTWIQLMKKELSAGAWKVIAEARESGTVGIYDSNGEIHNRLVHKIHSKIDSDKIIWEAPLKTQQTYFITLEGANVNLGNIAPNDVIPLETLRLGLRSDTFHLFLNTENN